MEAQSRFDLPVSNPFFQPYAGEVFVQADLLAMEKKSTLVEFSVGSFEGSTTSYASNLSTKVAIADSFNAGVSGRYMFSRAYSEARTGALAATPGSNLESAGFYDPGLSLMGRFLGTRRDEQYLDFEAVFKPGIQDSNYPLFSVPNNSYQLKIGLGQNSGDWTLGAGLLFQYWQKSSRDTAARFNDKILAGGTLFVQWDLEDFYVRISVGAFKFLDAASNNDALAKKVRPLAGFELGFPIADDVVLSTQINWVPSASADYSLSILRGTITDGNALTVQGSVAFRF